MKNGKPSNLFPLLRAVGHPFGSHQKAYEKHFCAGSEKSFGPHRRAIWDANGSSNLPQLKRLAKSHLLYLTKEECISSELPSLTRTTRQVPVSPRCQLQYTEKLKDLVRARGVGRIHLRAFDVR